MQLWKQAKPQICFTSLKSVHHIIPQSFHLKACKCPQILDSHRSLLCKYEILLLLHLHQTFFSSWQLSGLSKPLCLFLLQVLNALFYLFQQTCIMKINTERKHFLFSTPWNTPVFYISVYFKMVRLEVKSRKCHLGLQKINPN